MKPPSLLALVEHDIQIAGGVDANAQHAVSTRFCVAGTDNLIPYYDGLAMLELAKQDFIRRHQIHAQENPT